MTTYVHGEICWPEFPRTCAPAGARLAMEDDLQLGEEANPRFYRTSASRWCFVAATYTTELISVARLVGWTDCNNAPLSAPS